MAASDVSDVQKALLKFTGILQMVSSGDLVRFDNKTAENAFQWARYLDNMSATPDSSVTEGAQEGGGSGSVVGGTSARQKCHHARTMLKAFMHSVFLVKHPEVKVWGCHFDIYMCVCIYVYMYKYGRIAK
jgi:hypothetical protein